MDSSVLAVLVILAVVVVGLYFALRQKKAPDPEHAHAPQSDKFENGKIRDISVRRASEKINVPPPADGHGSAHAHGGVPEPVYPATIATNKTGDPSLVRSIDLRLSTCNVVPDSKLFAPGDAAELRARILDAAGQPVAGVPVFFRNRVQRRDLSKPVLTDGNGVAIAPYTVQAADMIGDPSTPEPDTGSYTVDCYAGGRLIEKPIILHDVN